MISPQTEKEIHQAFDLTLILKGIHAFLEIVGGIFFYMVSGSSIVRIVEFFVKGEIQEDPHNIIANYFLQLAHSFGGSSQSFAALYLLGHGIINGVIVVALWKEKLWAYPGAIIVLTAFIFYQCYLLAFAYSFWLVAFTVLDIVIIFLVWHEYGVVKKKKTAGGMG